MRQREEARVEGWMREERRDRGEFKLVKEWRKSKRKDLGQFLGCSSSILGTRSPPSFSLSLHPPSIHPLLLVCVRACVLEGHTRLGLPMAGDTINRAGMGDTFTEAEKKSRLPRCHGVSVGAAADDHVLHESFCGLGLLFITINLGSPYPKKQFCGGRNRPRHRHR